MNFFVIARLPERKPWQSQERLLRRFDPRNDREGVCHCEPAEGGRGNLKGLLRRFAPRNDKSD